MELNKMKYNNFIHADCIEFLNGFNTDKFDLTFMDPPFNQGKQYHNHDDNMDPKEYWKWMKNVCIVRTEAFGCSHQDSRCDTL